jgi:CRP-like cAMP-binding protein
MQQAASSLLNRSPTLGPDDRRAPLGKSPAPILQICGDWAREFALLEALYEAGYQLHLMIAERSTVETMQPAALTLVALGDPHAAALDTLLPRLGEGAAPWLCWNRADDPGIALAAYSAGALAVLRGATTGALLLQSVRNALTLVAPAPATLARARHYTRDELIALPADAVLDIRAGVVAQSVLHADGSEVLLGLCGPGQLLVGHPEDDCCLQLVAHTDVTVRVRRWDEACRQPDFATRLRSRLRQMEAWSAMGARHYLDQRLLGIIELLGEQFGRPHDAGTLVDVRITHAQLAAAIGATRTTVTRLLGDLRARGLLSVSGSGPHERFCLPDGARHSCHH